MERFGSGTALINTSPVPSRLVNSTMLSSICGSWRRSCSQTTSEAGDARPCNGNANSTGAEPRGRSLSYEVSTHPQHDLARRLASEADYFERNAERRRYPSFRKQGLIVASEVPASGSALSHVPLVRIVGISEI